MHHRQGKLHRHGKDKAGARAVGGVKVDLAVHLGGYLTADTEAKAGSLDEVVQFHKTLKDALCLPFRNAGAAFRSDRIMLIP